MVILYWFKYSCVLSIDLQYSMAIQGSEVAANYKDEHEDPKKTIYNSNNQRTCDQCKKSYSSSDETDTRIQELENFLQLQGAKHHNEMKHATARIQELEKSISTDREINRLQNRCKDLYHDEDEIVLRRIGDISDRAARRDLEHHQRYNN